MVIDMQKEQIPNKWGSLLETFAEPLVVRNFDEAQAVLYSGEADATIIDLKSTVDDALIFVASLRSTAQFYNHPVLLNISDERELSLERTFSAGINDLFVGNMQVEDVKARVSALLRHERLRKHLSEECDSSGDSLTRDSLCGLFTFGFGMAHLQQLELDMRRINQPVTLAMLHFTSLPSINSQFGYAAGDSILRQVALIVRNCLRGEDVCVRYSGRTMMLVFPEIAQDDATVAINRLLSILRYTMFVLPQADSSLPIQFEHSLTEWMPGEDIQQAIARLDLGPTIRSKAA
jgi:two-component system cell cycle response regulator